MRYRLWISLAGVFVMAVLAAAPALGQDDITPDTATGTQGKSDASADEDKGKGTDSQIRPGRDVKRAMEDSELGPGDPEKQMIRQVMLEEAKYRKRMAKIKRLRVLAKEQGNEQRLQALERLEKRLGEMHQRKTMRWRERMGDARYGQVQEHMKRGKGKGKAKGRAGKSDADGGVAGPGAGQRGKSDAPGKGKAGGGSDARGGGKSASPGRGGGGGKSDAPGRRGGGGGGKGNAPGKGGADGKGKAPGRGGK